MEHLKHENRISWFSECELLALVSSEPHVNEAVAFRDQPKENKQQFEIENGIYRLMQCIDTIPSRFWTISSISELLHRRTWLKRKCCWPFSIAGQLSWRLRVTYPVVLSLDYPSAQFPRHLHDARSPARAKQEITFHKQRLRGRSNIHLDADNLWLCLVVVVCLVIGWWVNWKEKMRENW